MTDEEVDREIQFLLSANGCTVGEWERKLYRAGYAAGQRERDELRELLRESRGWINAFEEPLDAELIARIDAALGSEGKG